MKILWLSHFIPYPPRGGAHQRSFNLIRHISAKHETHLVALNMQGENPGNAAEYAGELRKHCASVEIWEPPYPWKGARWWAQLAFSPFYRHPYGCHALWSPGLGRRWEAKLREHSEALVHFDSIDLALYLPPAATRHKVLNHHNCESAMAERRAQKESNPLAKVYLWSQTGKLRRLEEAVCHQFDVNLTVSELDKQTLLARSPRAHCHVVKNGTDTGYFTPAESEVEPNSLVFAASLRWYPNISGINYFAREIWPLIKSQSPGVRCYLAGKQPDGSLVRWAAQDAQVTLIPNPPDIRPWVARGAVFICPIVDGGGTRLKLLDALASGKAIVSTSIGSEGLHLQHGEHYLSADKPSDFAREVVRLIQDSDLRTKLGSSGRRFAVEHYAWQVIGGELERAYNCGNGEKCADSNLKGGESEI